MIRVLIVDDSTFVRRVLRRILNSAEDIVVVGEARTGKETLELIPKVQPDVITLDMELPDMSGLEILRYLKQKGIASVVVISSYTREGSELAIQALEEGAFDFVDKTQVQNRFDFMRISEEIITKIHLATKRVPISTSSTPTPQPPSIPVVEEIPLLEIGKVRGIVCIGASTGGPIAIRTLFSTLRPGLPVSFFVVQHIPPNFASGFADRLKRYSPFHVHLLSGEERIVPGHAYVVPSGFRLQLVSSDPLTVNLTPQEESSTYRPSLDETISALLPSQLPFLLVVLTGMGSDGKQGSRWVREKRGKVVVQDEKSSTVYGMPKVVKEEGEVAFEGSPEEIGSYILKWIGEEVEQWKEN